jgi:hypothetical protein
MRDALHADDAAAFYRRHHGSRELKEAKAAEKADGDPGGG